MGAFRNLSIRWKLMVIITLAISAGLVPAGLIFFTYEIVMYRKSMTEEISTVGQLVGATTNLAVALNDPKTANENLAALKAEQRILTAAIYGKDDKFFAGFKRGDSDFPAKPGALGARFENERLILYRQIKLENEWVGTLYLESDLRALYARVYLYGWITLAVVTMSTLLALALSTRLQRFISVPILDLSQTAKRVSVENNYSLRANKKNDDEVGLLIDSFNTMLSQIQAREAELQVRTVELAGANLALKDEVAVRTRAERELNVAKEELVDRLRDMNALQELTVRLASTVELNRLYQEVLAGVMGLHDTSKGALLLYDAETQELHAAANQGLTLDHAARLTKIPSKGGVCGAALSQRKLVVVRDVRSDPIFAPDTTAPDAGYRAMTSMPLLSHTGHILGAIETYFEDTRALSEWETRLTELYIRHAGMVIENVRLFREAKTAVRAKDEFLAMLSHELRTPLTPILTWSNLLRGGTLDAANQARGLEVVERNARMQAQLIADILDVSRIITGKLPLEFSRIEPAAVIHNALETVRPAAEAKQITLESDFEANIGEIAGDGMRLQQVMWNLLNNAIKFTPAGGRVQVKLTREDRRVKVTVADNGEGISADFLPYVFDRFRQADSSSTRKHGGLGLGMAIARHIVEAHRGTIEVYSAGKEKGSTFTLWLPLADASQKSAAPMQFKSSIARRAPSLVGLEILVVDDEPDLRELLVMAFGRFGAKVSSASSAREAFAAFQEHVPQLIISDLQMPEEDGYSLVERIRADSAGGKVPIIALTASASNEDRQRALQAGFNVHISKPVDIAELIVAIDELVRR